MIPDCMRVYHDRSTQHPRLRGHVELSTIGSVICLISSNSKEKISLTSHSPCTLTYDIPRSICEFVISPRLPTLISKFPCILITHTCFFRRKSTHCLNGTKNKTAIFLNCPKN